MFMVKSEYANIKNLVKVKMMTHVDGLVWFCIVAAFLYLASFAVKVFGILNDEGIQPHVVTDFSVSFFFGMMIVFVIVVALYRQTNNNLSVFPQTNTSRFISSQIINCAFAFCVGTFTLVMYLLYYGVIRLFTVYKENVYLALNFDVGFLAAGFLVFMAYSFLMIAVIELAGVIARKWKYYALTAFAALMALAIVNSLYVVEYAPKILAFLIREQSVGIFMVKAAVLWLAMTAAALVINRRTVYYKSQNPVRNKKTLIVCVAVSTVILCAAPLVIAFHTISNVSVSVSVGANTQAGEGFVDDYFAGATETRIDISHLPRGSNISLKSENIDITAAGGPALMSNSGYLLAHVSGTDALENIQGDTVVILFRPPFYNVEGVDLFDYANPQMSAYLENDTLHIDYSIAEDVHVVVLPVWGLAGQFGSFRDKGFISGVFLRYSGGGNMIANIYITVE